MAARPLTYWRPSWILLKIDFRPLQHILWKILTRIVGLNSSLLLLVTVLQRIKVLQNPLFFTILPKNVYLWQPITQVLNWVLTTLNPLFGSKFSIEYLAMVKNWFWAKSKMAANRPGVKRPSWKWPQIVVLTTKSNSMENPDVFWQFKLFFMWSRTFFMNFSSFEDFSHILYRNSRNKHFFAFCFRYNSGTPAPTALKFCTRAYFIIV